MKYEVWPRSLLAGVGSVKCQISKIISFTTTNIIIELCMNSIMISERLVQKHPVPTVALVITIIDSDNHKDRDGCGVCAFREEKE